MSEIYIRTPSRGVDEEKLFDVTLDLGVCTLVLRLVRVDYAKEMEYVMSRQTLGQELNGTISPSFSL